MRSSNNWAQLSVYTEGRLLQFDFTFMESVLLISSKTALRALSSCSRRSVEFLSCLRKQQKAIFKL